MKRFAFAIPGDLATQTGGYAYDRRMIAELAALGWIADVVGLGEGFPHPTTEQKRDAEARLEATAPTDPLVVDGLALGVLPEVARRLSKTHRLIALVHHPLAFETGVSEQDVQHLRATEREALAHSRAVIVTSPPTARLLVSDFGVAETDIAVALPGTEQRAPAQGSRSDVIQLVSVGAIVPRKGFDVLIEALACLRHRNWHLTIAGDRTRDAGAATKLDAAIARHDLAARVTVLGAVSSEHLDQLLAGADLFVLASHFEGYGMAYAEALAHGLPVIGTTGGAIPETVPASAGILVEPGNVDQLAAALDRLITDHAERERFAAGARSVAATLPTWRDSAKRIASVLESMA